MSRLRLRSRPKVPRKSPAEIEQMRQAGAILARTLTKLCEALRPGVSTAELDELAEAEIRGAGAIPSFKGYNGYPASLCAEIEDVVVHGIPSATEVLREGTLVGFDLGCIFQDWHSDAAFTAAVGDVDDERQRLLRVTRECLDRAIAAARPGAKLAEVCRAVQAHAEAEGFGVVRSLVGHGIGRRMHEPPQIPNFVDEGGFAEYDLVLRPGMTLAIEPMITAGTYEVRVDRDGWTTRTADGKPAAHFEHTVAVTKDGASILTPYKLTA
jgi:methionyl aminopeptidase